MPNCPMCQSEYTYEDRGLFVCQNVVTNGLKAKMWKRD